MSGLAILKWAIKLSFTVVGSQSTEEFLPWFALPATLIIVDDGRKERRFNNKSGYETGNRDAYHHRSLEEATQERMDDIRQQALASRLAKHAWNSMSLEDLRAVWALVNKSS